MENPFAIRIDSNAQQWGGNNLTQGEKQNRRRQKLQALLQNLKAGDLDASRMAFTALVNFDPSVSADPYLSKIGTALQSSNLHAAQHFALELQSRGAQLQSHLPVHDPVSISQPKDPWDVYSGISRIDLSA